MWVSRLASALRAGGGKRSLAASALCLPLLAQAALQPGASVINNARLLSGSTPLAAASVSVRVASNISFLRYSPVVASGHGTSTHVNITQCQGVNHYEPSFSGGTSGSLPYLPADYPLESTTYFVVGEPLFMQVTDQSRNLSSSQVDTLAVTVSNPAKGDSQTILISETGPDTGEFIGFVNTGDETPGAGDCRVAVAKGDQLDVSYNNEAVASAALVDPYGLVFDSASGARLNGVRVRIVDAATGNPAQVYGDDGAPYPSEVLTGSSVTAGALTYNFADGEYRFPLVASGQDYRLLVDQLPPGYAAPTAQPDSHFSSVPDGPYVVGAGSRQDDFPVPAGPPVRVDIPLDAASSGLFVVKSAGASEVAIGDLMSWNVQVQNTLSGSAFTAVVLHDKLPPGLRYRNGSMRVDDKPAPDPVISGDGRSLTLNLGTLAAKAAFRVSYVTEISAATRPGEARNTAFANSGNTVSNQAQAVVQVREDLMRSRSLLAGRVLMTESCSAADLAAAKPVAAARIYLETGRYVLSDERGRWHFDDIRPGSHVLQLDKNGLPANSEIIACENHTRSAGNAGSQFVDVQGGMLWQTDFYLRQNRPLHYTLSEIREKASVQLRSEKTEKGLRFSLELNHSGVDLDETEVAVSLPTSLRYVADSLRLDDNVLAGEQAKLAAGGESWIYLGRLAGEAGQHRLVWEAEMAASQPVAEQTVSANVTAHVGGQRVELAGVSNQFKLVQPEKLGRVIIFRPRFASFSTELAKADRDWLDDIANDLRDAGDIRLEVVGHSDNTKVVPRKGRVINDNYALSAARAQSVADYLRRKIGLAAERVSVAGRGPDEPMADNKTEKGRETNRRVELRVFAAAVTEAMRVETTFAESAREESGWSRWVSREVADTLSNEKTAANDVPVPEDNGIGILSFRDGEVLANRVQAIRVRADARLQLELAVDGRIIPSERVGFTKSEGKNTLLAYIGVDLGEAGVHEVSLKGRDPFGNIRLNQSVKVTVAGDITRMRLAQGPENVADGRRPVTLKLELLDGSGSVVPAAVDLRLVSGELRPLVTGDAQRAVADSAGKLPVSADGTVKFAPVTRSGLYTIEIAYGNKLVEKFPVYVRPEKRDWILVGLAEGSLAAKSLSGNMESISASGESDDLWQDGRLAFFAKGRIKGEWLLTLAYDTDREKTTAFGGAIDPTRYYTLYADASDPRYDAASRKKLYLRIEKDAFYALFGDYDTGMTVTELGRYSRTMTGFKTEYHDSRFDLNLFAADTGQAYRRDEIRGNGTSGIYALRTGNILSGSDKIRIEVRDRYKSEIVLSSQVLTRYNDYSLDEVRGEVFFKSPVPSQDANFNPVWIVAEYEVEAGSGAAINAGGRGAVKFAEGRAVLGASVVREDSGLGSGNLTAVDGEWRLNPHDVLRAEVAGTRTEDSVQGDQSGSAYLLEWKRDSQKLKSRVYLREEESGFGLGQQNASEDGVRKIGAEGRYQFRQDIFFTSDIFRQEMIDTGARRDMFDVRGEYQHDAYALTAGLRHAAESLRTGDVSTEQLTVGGRYRLLGSKLTLRANGEIGINGQSGAQDFPDRLLLGADYQWHRNVTLSAEQEWTFSDLYSTQTSRAGIKYQPWKGASVGADLDHETMEAGSRLRAGLGLGQRLTLTPEWTADLGYDQASTLKDNRSASFNPVQPSVFGPSTDDFWAAFAGANYQHSDIKGVMRLERRDAETNEQWNLVGGAYRELNAEMALAAGLTATFADEASGSSSDRVLLRGSLAWRPDRLHWLLLQQLDYGLDRKQSSSDDSTGQRLVSNTVASKRWERDQLSLQYGAKYVFSTIDDTRYSGYTDLMGAEWRHDLDARWDVGLRGSVLHSWTPGVLDYSLGVSVGVTPVRNAWFSLGYNFTGFRDSDFRDAEYSGKGLFLKMRLKVDQDSIRQIWNDARGVFGAASPATGAASSDQGASTEAQSAEQNIDALAAPSEPAVAVSVSPTLSASAELTQTAAVAAPLADSAMSTLPAPPSPSVSKAASKVAPTLPVTKKTAVKASAKTVVAAPLVSASTKSPVTGVAASKAPVKTDAKGTVANKDERIAQHRAQLKQRQEREARLERLAMRERQVQRLLKTEEKVATPEDSVKNDVSIERDKRRAQREKEREIRERRERMEREKAKAERLLNSQAKR